MGCATPGHVYDDDKVSKIKKEVTTEADLLTWFGPASSRSMGPDGSKILAWKFAHKAARTGPAGNLQVHLDPEGRVRDYSASAGVR
jgi:hypothetical protein